MLRTNFKSNKPSFEESETRRSFQISDKVWVKKEIKGKEDELFEGPATIEEQFHPRSYQLKFEDGRKLRRNIEWLKPFKTRKV